jgi:hypothetical protein
MQYTEEHYAEMYNNLPEGLKDLVLSGRLAILVSAIGSRHGLNADQVADLEPAIEDVCLGLITADELVDNIVNTVNVDQRVANRIAAEAELEILKPYEAELVISRKQKEDLDAKIMKTSPTAVKSKTISNSPVNTANNSLPKDVSEHANAEEKKVSEWYNKGDKATTSKVSFDWDTDFGKTATAKKEADQVTTENTAPVSPTLETKLDVLTESINKLVNSRFGSSDKKEEVSTEMQELLKRLEKAEKENEENKKIIRSLQNQKEMPIQSIFGNASDAKQNKIQIDKQRKVDIDHTEPGKADSKPNGNVQVTSISTPIPIQKDESNKKPEIISSLVSKDTVDSIVETRNKPAPSITSSVPISMKKSLSLEELISKGDSKIKEAKDASGKPTAGSGTLVFPGLNDEKKVDIKNLQQKESLKQTLLDDLEFLKGEVKGDGVPTQTKTQNNQTDKTDDQGNDQDTTTDEDANKTDQDLQSLASSSSGSPTLQQFKDEILPKTKEERMKALQEKIKSLNKGVSVGGKTNISSSGLDPYRI